MAASLLGETLQVLVYVVMCNEHGIFGLQQTLDFVEQLLTLSRRRVRQSLQHLGGDR